MTVPFKIPLPNPILKLLLPLVVTQSWVPGIRTWTYSCNYYSAHHALCRSHQLVPPQPIPLPLEHLCCEILSTSWLRECGCVPHLALLSAAPDWSSLSSSGHSSFRPQPSSHCLFKCVHLTPLCGGGGRPLVAIDVHAHHSTGPANGAHRTSQYAELDLTLG